MPNEENDIGKDTEAETWDSEKGGISNLRRVQKGRKRRNEKEVGIRPFLYGHPGFIKSPIKKGII